MVEHEIITYNPDVLTLYAGYNDASSMAAPSTTYKILTWIHGHFASYVAFKKVVTMLGGPELPSRWHYQPAGPSPKFVDQQIQLHTMQYRANVERIVAAAKARGARLILVKQALTTGWGDKTHVTYQEKVDGARKRLAAGGRITDNETVMIVHSALMNVLDSVSAEHGLPIIDNIEIVNNHPEYFASYVHLTEAGNLALAQALRPAVETLIEAHGP
jgi:lysophospholipase L1-like esterase